MLFVQVEEAVAVLHAHQAKEAAGVGKEWTETLGFSLPFGIPQNI